MSFESPISVLVDEKGNLLTVSSSQEITSSQSGIPLMGSSSLGWSPFKLDDEGVLFITGNLGSSTIDPVEQGTAGTINESWFFRITDGIQVIGTGSSAPLFVSGAVTVNNLVSTQVVGDVNITGSVVVDNIVDITGSVGITSISSPVITREIGYPTTIVTGFVASNTSVQALAPNANRSTAIFYMDGNSRAYIKLGDTASENSFTVRLTNNSYWELPKKYTGRVDVIFNNNFPNNILRITEISE